MPSLENFEFNRGILPRLFIFIIRFLLTIIIIIIFSKSEAQTVNRTVVDIRTNQPISYAAIKILHKPMGAIASQEGAFELAIDAQDSVLFSCIGYRNKKIVGKDAGSIIYLEPKVKSLETITIRPTKLLQTLILGQDTSNFKDDLNWGPGGQAEFAEKIDLPDTNRLYKLKKVFLRLKKHDCYGPLLLHIYQADSVSGVPGEEIFSTLVHFNKSNVKKNKATLDLTEHNIYWQDSKSFFIGFSWLPSAWEQKCLTTLFFLQRNYSHTYTRSISLKDYKWYQFYWGKDQAGNPSHASMFFSVEVDELK
jgi:hypothetical protein